MNPNVLCSISEQARDNFTVVALDNGTYGSTGDQCTAAQQLDLELLARVLVSRTQLRHTRRGFADCIAAPDGS